jgi:N,N'-diacetyllegionaminate synthase
MKSTSFAIGSRVIGRSRPCFIIAEAGVNHNGDPRLARELILAAARAGADAVKFQTFRTEELVTAHAPKADYQKRTTDIGESQQEMLRKLELPLEIYPELRARAEGEGLAFLSTPFDVGSVDFLADLGVSAFKIPSGELTHPALVTRIASKDKPLLVSTGMSTLDEVADAVRLVEAQGAHEFCLLQCTSNYPADPADVNLRAMVTMERIFGVVVGFSDHTEGIEVALAAVALGAAVIEKHFTLDRTMAGPDHAASLEPAEFQALVRGVRKVETALGTGEKKPAAGEQIVANVVRRSLVAARDIPTGAVLTEDDIACKRPGVGIAPGLIREVLGRRAARSIAAGDLLAWEDFA